MEVRIEFTRNELELLGIKNPEQANVVIRNLLGFGAQGPKTFTLENPARHLNAADFWDDEVTDESPT